MSIIIISCMYNCTPYYIFLYNVRLFYISYMYALQTFWRASFGARFSRKSARTKTKASFKIIECFCDAYATNTQALRCVYDFFLLKMVSYHSYTIYRWYRTQTQQYNTEYKYLYTLYLIVNIIFYDGKKMHK